MEMEAERTRRAMHHPSGIKYRRSAVIIRWQLGV